MISSVQKQRHQVDEQSTEHRKVYCVTVNSGLAFDGEVVDDLGVVRSLEVNVQLILAFRVDHVPLWIVHKTAQINFAR